MQTVYRGRKVLAYGVALAALMAGAAQAQQQPKPTDLGEVVVTAQKRSERLLDVPIPVTAVESQKLVEQNLVRLQDYATRIPGLRATSERTTSISLRGVTAIAGASPTVAVTIDDVPYGSTTWVGQGIFPDLDPSDLSRLEVLRGPQGTLYGAASLGGLIKLVTKDPDTNDFSGRLEVGGSHSPGGGDGYVVRAAVNVPILKDKIGLRLSGFERSDAPYVDNVNPGVNKKNANKSKYFGMRQSLMFQPFDELDITLSHMKQKQNTLNIAPTLITPYPTDYQPRFGYFVVNTGSVRVNNTTELTTGRINLDVDFATLTAVTGWSRARGNGDTDQTNSFGFVFSVIYPGSPAGSQARISNYNATKKFSQEVRLASKSGGKFDWLAGFLYTDEDTILNQDLGAFRADGSKIGGVVILPGPSTYKEKAAFGDVTYHFDDKFEVQVGARYSQNKQTYSSNQIVTPAAVPIFGQSITSPVVRSSENAFTFLITPKYKFNDDLMFYGRIASGFRPGGPNTATAPKATFESDTVVNYEVGAKGYLFDRRVTVDASVFDIEWDKIQLGTVSATNISYIANGGKARSRGVEGAVQFRPAQGWTVNANATLTDAKLLDNIPQNPAPAANLLGFAGDRLPQVPKFAANLGLEKSWNVFADYRVTLGGNVSHVGQRNMAYRTSAAPVARRGTVSAPSYNQIDLFATLTNNVWSANAYVRNLGSRRGIISINDSAGQSANTSAEFIAPEVYGISLSRTF